MVLPFYYWVSSTLPTDKPRHFLNFRVFRWIHPFEFPLIFTSKQLVSPSVYRISTLTSFPPFDPEMYWVPNPLRKHLLALIALSHQFNTALSVLASSPLSPPLLSPSFLLHFFPCTDGGVCNLLATRWFFLVFIFFPLSVFMLTRWSKTQKIAHVAVMVLSPLTTEAGKWGKCGKKTLFVFSCLVRFLHFPFLHLFSPCLGLKLFVFFSFGVWLSSSLFFSSAKLAGKGFSEALVSAPLSGLAMAS